MFTGLIADLGSVVELERNGSGATLRVQSELGAGLKPGDVIIEVDGRKIDSLDKYRIEMIRHASGTLVPVTFIRGAETKETKVKAMRSPKKKTVNALLECSFKKNATLAIVPGTTSSTMTVVANNQPVVTIALGATAGTARYNSKLCKSKPPIA